MCYLKNITPEEEFDFNKLWDKSEESMDETPCEESNVLIPCGEKGEQNSWSKDQELLVRLFGTVQRNNHLISRMDKFLTENLAQQQSVDSKLQKLADETHQESSANIDFVEAKGTHQSKNPLVKKIFGEQSYKYHFELASEFPDTIYKERNFEIKLRLCDQKGNVVLNGNLINICLAACTEEGEWIHENRNGEAFLKGKAEIEVYHGEGLFHKIYTRDISRNYPGKKVIFMIYGKPSMLVYSNQGEHKNCIDPSQIEPLAIQNITIKAKKKQ